MHRPARSPRRPGPWPRPHPRRNDGFTLIELLIVMTIIPIVIGALSLGLILVFTLQNSVGNRVTDAGDAQVVSSTFLKDVQSAQMITEEPALACGTGLSYSSTPTQLLGLEWGDNGGTYADTVSYISEQNPGLSSYSLLRQLCTGAVTTTPSLVTTVATDLSAAGASALPYIACATNPVDPNCAPSYFTTGWMSTGDVQYVLLSAQEHALLPSPNSSTPFVLTLSAAPRVHLEAATDPTASSSTAPLTVLGTSCATPQLVLSNNVTVSINVAGGTGNGSLSLGPNCPSVQVDNGSVLDAGAVLTANPNLDSVVEYPSGTTYPVPEYYTPDFTDPYADLVPPSTSTTGLNPGSCTQSGGVWTCSAGYYASDPGVEYFSSGSATVNFTTTNCTVGPDGCRFLFEKGLSLPNGVAVNFATGVYVFEPNSSNVALSCSNNASINGAITGGSQELLYIAQGSVSFANDITINLAGLSDYKGVTIWDADSSPSDPLQIGNNSGAYSGYGGIYAPNQAVDVNNNGTITLGFLVAQSMSFENNVTLNITSP